LLFPGAVTVSLQEPLDLVIVYVAFEFVQEPEDAYAIGRPELFVHASGKLLL